MVLKQYCNTSWSQTARLLLGTGKTVYTFLHQTCEAYLLVVRLKKGVKKQKQQKKTKKRWVKGLGEIFARMGLFTFSNISKAYRVLRATDCIEIIGSAL